MRWDEMEMEDSQLARNMISKEWTSTTAAQPYELFTRVQPRFIQIPIVSVVPTVVGNHTGSWFLDTTKLAETKLKALP